MSETAVTYETLFEIAGKVNSSFTAGFQSVTQTIDSLDKKVRDLQTVQTKVTRFEGLNQELLNTQQNFEQTRERVKRLGTELISSDRVLGALHDQLKTARSEFNRLGDEIQKSERPTTELKESLKAANTEVSRLEKN